MSSADLDNPILNSPYEAPERHFALGRQKDADAFAISVADASRLRHLLHLALNEPPPNPDAVVVPNPFR